MVHSIYGNLQLIHQAYRGRLTILRVPGQAVMGNTCVMIYKLWWGGPDLLNCQENKKIVMPAECVSEMKAVTHSLLTPPKSSTSANLEQLISCKNYSTLPRLLWVTAYVIRFIRLLKQRGGPTSPSLESEEIGEAVDNSIPGTTD